MVITGLFGFELLIAVIVLFSACLPEKSVEATPISSPTYQSTGSHIVMEVAPTSAV
jgi:hypothetical protein